MNSTFALLVRREFWEHRSLWMAPLIWVGILIFLWIWVLFVLGHNNAEFQRMDNAQTVEEIRGIDDQEREQLRDAIKQREHDNDAMNTLSYLLISALISGLTMLVVFFYLIDCLFSERRDRSILFWKSMPISDTQVVLSKLAVAMVVVPIGVLALTSVTQIVVAGLLWLRVGGTIAAELTPDWTFVAWLRAMVIDGSIMIGGVLWYAPIAAWFLLLSVWARKLVFLWAIIPLIATPLLELLFFRTSHVAEFLQQRFTGYVKLLNLSKMRFNDGASVAEQFNSLTLQGIFTSGEMWLGLVVAGALVYLTIFIRRHRDET